MAADDDFIQGCTTCFNANPDLPQFGVKLGPFGLKNMLLGLFLSLMAGINFVLDIIANPPPSLPSLQIFIDGFMAGINFPCDHATIDIGGGFSIPEHTGSGICSFDISGAFKMVEVFIKVPFELIKLIINELPTITIPTPTIATNLFISIGASIGLTAPAFGTLAGCLGTAASDLLTNSIS